MPQQGCEGDVESYEATFLGYPGEDILEEANAFTTIHLRDINQHISSDHLLAQAISHALDLPVHRRTRKLEARWHIDAYGQREDANTVLLEAAVLDFNIVQSTLQRDLYNVRPEYMKVCFLALYNTVNAMTYEALKEQGHNILPYLTKAWADMLKAFLQEARWSHDKHIPSFDDYFRNAWVSASGVVFLFHANFFLNHKFSEESLQSLDPYHHLLRCRSVIFRLCNDLGASKAELERGEAASSIVCYKHQSGATEENSHKFVRGLVDETWKEMNKARGMESKFSKAFVETAMNLARISHCTYQYGDGHGAPDSTSKNRV